MSDRKSNEENEQKIDRELWLLSLELRSYGVLLQTLGDDHVLSGPDLHGLGYVLARASRRIERVQRRVDRARLTN